MYWLLEFTGKRSVFGGQIGMCIELHTAVKKEIKIQHFVEHKGENSGLQFLTAATFNLERLINIIQSY